MAFHLHPTELAEPVDLAEFDLHDDTYAGVTHEMYRGFRQRCPFGRSEKHGGYWVALDYETCRAVAHDPATFSSSVITVPDVPGGLTAVPITLDPPEHAKYRKLLQAWFSSRRVSVLEPVIRRAARQLIGSFTSTGKADLAEDYARPLAFMVIAEILGVPESDQEQARYLADRFLQMDAGDDASRETMTQWATYTQGLINDRRNNPRDDLLSFLLAAQVDDEPVGEDILSSIVFLLVFAGIDTSSKVLATTLGHLARHQDLRQHLLDNLDDTTLLADAVEEFIRVFAPSVTARRVQTDTQIAGQNLTEGDLVVIGYPSANFDDNEFPDPEQIRIGRHPNRHFAFGIGIHRCLGMHLARVEIRAGLEELLRAIPAYTIAEGHQPSYSMHGEVAGIVALPVTFAAGGPEQRR